MTLIKRYAEGFLEYAKDTIGFENALDELKWAKDIFRQNPDFQGFLENPAINYAEKSRTIDKTLAGGFSQEMRDFLKLLLKKERISLFGDIVKYARIKYAHGEKAPAVMYTTYVMSTDFLGRFKTALEDKLHTGLQLYIDLAPDMLGGVRVVFGNKILDGSVKKRFENLKRKLTAVKVT